MVEVPMSQINKFRNIQFGEFVFVDRRDTVLTNFNLMGPTHMSIDTTSLEDVFGKRGYTVDSGKKSGERLLLLKIAAPDADQKSTQFKHPLFIKDRFEEPRFMLIISMHSSHFENRGSVVRTTVTAISFAPSVTMAQSREMFDTQSECLESRNFVDFPQLVTVSLRDGELMEQIDLTMIPQDGGGPGVGRHCVKLLAIPRV